MITRKQAGGVLLAAALAAILVATLTPVDSPGSAPTALCIVCGERGMADFLSNVILFAPLGIALVLLGVSAPVAVAAGVLLSAGVEAAQLGIVTGRDANLGDVVANGTGALVGWWLGRTRGWWVAPEPLWSPKAATVAGAVIGVLVGGLYLLGPSLPETTWYLQWTARFGSMEPYQGRVLATRFGTMELDGPPWRIAQTDSLRRILIGAPIAITFEAGPPPSGLAPIVSIYDTRAREAMLVGADREDVVYRYRMKAESLRLDRPDFRVEGLLRDVRPGSVVQLEIISDRRAHCVTLDGMQHCQRGFTVGDTWSLLMFPDGWSAAVRTLMSLAWLAGAFGLVGVLAAHARLAAVVALASAALLMVMPPALGFVMTPPLQLGAVVVGIAAGHVLRRIIARRWPQSVPRDEVARRPE